MRTLLAFPRAAALGLAVGLLGTLPIALPSSAARTTPTPRAAAVVVSAGSGSWSDPRTWTGGVAPGPATRVVVRAGDRVTLDRDVQVHGVEVDGSLVLAPDRSVRLASDRNVVVSGTLQMTPATAAIVHELRFVGLDDSKFVGGGMGVIDSDVGLWVVGAGRLDLEGTPRTGWTNLAGALPAGATALTLASPPVGWHAGDEVFVAPTEAPTVGKPSWTGFEDTRIASVSGATLSLLSPARRAHPVVGGRWTAEVGDLTRNVKIDGTASGFAHVFIHSTSAQTIRYAELQYLGVAGVLGRYPLQFHHDGDGSRGSVIEGVVVHQSGNHAFVPHGSNGITFHDTIAYDIANDAYWWDPPVHAPMHAPTMTDMSDGSSSDIVIDHAIAALVHGPSGPLLTGFRLGQGAPGTDTIRDSVATGVDGRNGASGFAWKQATTAVTTLT